MFGSVKNEKKKINTSGIGLGLVISKMIVTQFNGQINYSSVFGVGSNFNYTFEIQEFDLGLYKQEDKIKNIMRKNSGLAPGRHEAK